MAIIVNTNMSALKTQKNLNNATNALNSSLERMSTGLKINSAKDDAAGLYVATGLNTQVRGSKVAQANVTTGANVLSTVEGNLDVVLDNLNRIRDLSVQAANSVYDAASQKAMGDEVQARLNEIDRVTAAANFNGLELFKSTGTLGTNGLRLQVGANADATANSITVDKSIFGDLTSTTLGKNAATGTTTGLTPATGLKGNVTTVFGNGTTAAAASLAAKYIVMVDAAIGTISTNKATIGATQNRLDAATSSLTTTIENNTAAKSTIIDADIASESAEYTKQQILQQTSATLLVQANQLPSLALNLIK